MSFVKADLEPTISKIVEAMLPRGSGKNKCLNVCVEVRFDNYDTEHFEVCILDMLFFRNKNYTQVLSKIYMLGEEKPDNYSQMSNHDSAWRNDGVGCSLNDTYRMAKSKFSDSEMLSEYVNLSRISLEGMRATDNGDNTFTVEVAETLL